MYFSPSKKSVAWLFFLLMNAEFALSPVAAIAGARNASPAAITKREAKRVSAPPETPSFFGKYGGAAATTNAATAVKPVDASIGADWQPVQLHSGPIQPEMKAFASVNSSDMVDPFTGDFSYNIPLLDVGGYPVSLSYRAGITMDQEASWVGLGWNVNPGTINRNVRGLPDDFNGSGDFISKTVHMRENRTIGVTGAADVELTGLPMDVTIGRQLGLFYNTYKGWGLESGLNASINSGKWASGALTAGLSATNNSQEGITINPTLSVRLFKYENEDKSGGSGTLNLSVPYQSRTGIKALQLGMGASAFKDVIKDGKETRKAAGSSFSTSLISFASPTFTPAISMPYTSRQYSFTAKVGLAQLVLHPSFSLTGYVSTQQIDDEDTLRIIPAYGYLHFTEGAGNRAGLMDYNREKELPYREKPGTPHIALPYYTYDAFSITGEGTGGMFRAYRGDIGYVSDHYMRSKDASTRASVDVGVPNLVHLGVDLNQNRAFSQNGPWMEHNMAANVIDFRKSDGVFESVYFRNPGEKAIHPAAYYEQLGGDDVVALKLLQQNSSRSAIMASPYLQRFRNKKLIGEQLLTPENVIKTERAKRTQVISTLTAKEASQVGLSKFILSYPVNDFSANSCDQPVFSETTESGLHAEYFRTIDLKGTPIVQTDTRIDFGIGKGTMTFVPTPSPPFPSDFFSARWTGRIRVPETGRYIFRSQTDDGFRLWINDTLCINDWTDHGDNTFRYHTLNLVAGEFYSFRAEYYDRKGHATARLAWMRPGSTTYEIVPSDVFFKREQRISTVSGVEIEKRTGGFRRDHHLSEISVLNGDGRRYVYGIPVYNFVQREATFSVNASRRNLLTGMAGYTHGVDNTTANNQGRDGYLSKEETPAHAQSFLLTSILSTDYVDITGNGISDDDLGDAVRFNYSRINNAANPYRWRAPWNKDSVNLAEGHKTDNRDDKGSYVYGERENWYLHTIESKTMIATFILENREDARGIGEDGALTNAGDAKRLKEIRLYSKAEFRKNPVTAVPVKVVHFEYSYELCKGIYSAVSPGSTTGKLTLKKVWFSYNGNNKGQKNPYVFYYNGLNPDFRSSRYVDRWGVYKDPSQNPSSSGLIRNDDYPYAVQDSLTAAVNASAWALDSIYLPSGGSMKIRYESDDYGYVQNKRVMQFFKLAGFGSSPQPPAQPSAALYRLDTDHLYAYVKLSHKVASKEAAYARYLAGVQKLYFRLSVRVPNDAFGSGNEYVPCYADLAAGNAYGLVNDSTLWIRMAGISLKGDEDGTYSPLAKAAIQFLRLNLPSKAYSGSETVDQLSFEQAIRMMAGLALNKIEMLLGFDRYARLRGWGRDADLNRSLVRLLQPTLKKYGGGHRVKQVLIYDNWDKMTGQRPAIYGQEYSYTDQQVMLGDTMTVSSGVASYEPGIGGEENPFRVPIEYVEKIAPLGPVTLGYSEEPLGESLFPSPDIGYSVVRVKNVHYKNAKSASGFTETRFFTAKDFPVITDRSLIDQNSKKRYKPALANFLRINAKHYIGISQGFKIELNDMHGKVRSQAAYSENDKKTPITRTDYIYKTAGGGRLSNTVYTAAKNGAVDSAAIIGKEVELMVDMREQLSVTNGFNVSLNSDIFAVPFIPPIFVIPSLISLAQREETKFNSVATTKMIHRYGILDSVVQFDKGSKISTRELVYDSETGDPVLNRTQNEFNDYIYNLSYPAHWRYEGMGHAYRNIGAVYDHVTIRGGKLTEYPAGLDTVLFSGDELLIAGKQRTGEGPAGCVDDISSFPVFRKLWVVDSSVVHGGTKALYFVDQLGTPYDGFDLSLKIIRSGRRNMGGSVGNVTMLESPLVSGEGGYALSVDSTKRVLNAGAAEYKEQWKVFDVKRRFTGSFCFRDSVASGIRLFNSGGVEVIHDMILTPNGGNMMVGSTTGYGVAATDGYIARTDSAGNLLWARTYGGAQHEYFYNITTLPGDHYAVIGVTRSFGDTRGNVFVTRINGSGEVVWSRLFRNNTTNGDIPLGIITTTEGNLAFSGGYNHANFTADWFAGTLTADGNLQWMKRFGNSNTSDPYPKVLESGDSLVLIGSDRSNGGYDYSLSFLTIGKDSGNIINHRAYKVDESINWIMDAAVDTGGYWVLGFRSDDYTSPLDLTTILLRVDFNGNVLSASRLPLQATDIVFYNALGLAGDGGVYITQSSESSSGNGYIQRVAANGMLNWSRILTIPGAKMLNRVRERSPGKYDMSGTIGGSMLLYKNDSAQFQNCFDTLVNLGQTFPDFTNTAGVFILNDRIDTISTIALSSVSRNPTVTAINCSFTDTCYTTSSCLSLVTDTTLNPYTTGLLGNWRMSRSYVYYDDRMEQDPTATTNTRAFGTIRGFEPYWQFNATGIFTEADTTKWVWNAQSLLFNAKGLEVENNDPLGRFNAGLYGYNNTLPTAVVQNGRLRESAFEGFEDYGFGTGVCDTSCVSDRHMDYGAYRSWMDTTQAHTGTTSLRVPAGETAGMSFAVSDLFSDMEGGRVRFTTRNDACVTGALTEMTGDAGLLLRGFEPGRGRRMVVSVWVREGASPFATGYMQTKLLVAFSGAPNTYTFSPVGAVVEGWQRFESVFEVPDDATAMSVGLQNNGGQPAYFDDLRIHPYNANMKSFVYHPSNLRLMAELDENNYASLYEYDDDGTLIRVKKETQRGIMTIKETRSALIKE